MVTEYWAHVYHEKPDYEEVEDVGFDQDSILAAMRDGKDWQDV